MYLKTASKVNVNKKIFKIVKIGSFCYLQLTTFRLSHKNLIKQSVFHFVF